MSNWKKESRPWLVLIVLGLIFSWGCQDPSFEPPQVSVQVKPESDSFAETTELIRLMSGTRIWYSPWITEFAQHSQTVEPLEATCRTFWVPHDDNQSRIIWADDVESLSKQEMAVAEAEVNAEMHANGLAIAASEIAVSAVDTAADSKVQQATSNPKAHGKVELSEKLADEAAVVEAVAKAVQAESSSQTELSLATSAKESLHELTTAAIRELTEKTNGLEIENELLRKDRVRLMKTLSKLSLRVEKLENKNSSRE